ncbi:riboflavin kinase [Oceanobacillus halophilus]|uniref:riboflavin kinase n=1 Tax=Oceanobacillus halophilus TaxID=930130 RepID=A0A495A1M8_9BACI|nr:riboflavin kinase [Oceanobacillus halophilus]RKQ33264.1 hypothetical protein D8M06_10855 [Oceanobacillus halophilus]
MKHHKITRSFQTSKTERANSPYTIPGIIRHNSSRNNIADYQTANLIINSAIEIPDPGIHSVKIKIDTCTYDAVAIISKTIINHDKQPMIKLFIKDFNGEFNNENVLVWSSHLQHSHKAVC